MQQQDVLSTPQQSPHRTKPKARKRKPDGFSNFSIEPADDFYGWHAVIWDAGMP